MAKRRKKNRAKKKWEQKRGSTIPPKDGNLRTVLPVDICICTVLIIPSIVHISSNM